VSAETNGRIRLSWPQIVWATATLAAVVGAWADMRSQMALLRQEMGLRVQQSEADHARMWIAIDDAKASTRPPEPTKQRR
jgi:hypothetical protein